MQFRYIFYISLILAFFLAYLIHVHLPRANPFPLYQLKPPHLNIYHPPHPKLSKYISSIVQEMQEIRISNSSQPQQLNINIKCGQKADMVLKQDLQVVIQCQSFGDNSKKVVRQAISNMAYGDLILGYKIYIDFVIVKGKFDEVGILKLIESFRKFFHIPTQLLVVNFWKFSLDNLQQNLKGNIVRSIEMGKISQQTFEQLQRSTSIRRLQGLYQRDSKGIQIMLYQNSSVYRFANGYLSGAEWIESILFEEMEYMNEPLFSKKIKDGQFMRQRYLRWQYTLRLNEIARDIEYVKYISDRKDVYLIEAEQIQQVILLNQYKKWYTHVQQAIVHYHKRQFQQMYRSLNQVFSLREDSKVGKLDTFSFDYKLGVYIPMVIPLVYPLIYQIYYDIE